MEEEVLKNQEAIDQVREILKDILPSSFDDIKILKFLRARKYDVNGAADMLRKNIRNRQVIGLDNLVNSDFTLPKKSLYFTTIPLGYDKQGALLRLIHCGNMDIKGLAMSHHHVEAAKMAALVMEKDKREQKKRFQETGEGGDDKQSYIIDLKGLLWTNILNRQVHDLFIFLLRLYEANYPESLKHAYVVNVPAFFGVIYNIAKLVLPLDILSKVDVVSSDKCARTLRSTFDPAQFPASLGGTLRGPEGDANCYSLFPIRPGQPVPEEYYMSNNLDNDPFSRSVTVQNQSVFKVELQVDVPDCFITWNYQTVESDVGMSLYYYKANKKERKCVQQMKRVNCHKCIETGFFECLELGTYEVVFDNSYSWWAKKKLFYRIFVIKPGEEIPELCP